MVLSEIAKTERTLPPIWKDGFNPDRLDFYTRLVLNHAIQIGGRDIVAEFVAAMMLESGLDNLTVGNNARNGSNNPYLGIGWCQLDTGYHAKTLDFVHEIRNNPIASLDYILATRDLCYVGANRVWFNTSRWHAWESEKLDPVGDVWSPLNACLSAYDRVIGS